MTLVQDGKLDRSSLLFRVAYMFTVQVRKPAAVDRCTLVVRFLLHLIPWVVLSLMAWVVLGVIFGILGQPLWRLWLFICEGRKLVYVSQGGIAADWLPCRQTLSKLTVCTYDRDDIDWMDWAQGPDFRSPFLMVIGCLVMVAICLGLLSLIFYYAPVYGAPWVWGVAITPGASYAYDLFGAWSGPLAWLVGILAALWGIRYASKRFAASQSGSVLVSYFKEWKVQHCPIYQVV